MDVKAYSGNEAFAFISYAHTDEELVEPILKQLSSQCIRFWYDKGIKSENWREKLANQVVSCRVMIVFLSQNYSESIDCKREVSLADDYRKDFILIRLDDAKLSGELAYILSGLQFRDSRTCSTIELVDSICDEQWADECKRKKLEISPVLKRFNSLHPYEMSWNGEWDYNQQEKYNSLWGPQREIFQNGNHPPFAVLNSEISDRFGDERQFAKIKEHSKTDYVDEIVLEPNKTYDVRILYHNNADFESNRIGLGIATNSRMAVHLPIVVFPGQLSLIRTGLQASVIQYDGEMPKDLNSIPPKHINVWSHIKVYTQRFPMFIEYVLGSAIIQNNGKANGNYVSTRLFSDNGTPLGFNKLAGTIPGGEEYAGYVFFQFRTYSPDINKDIVIARESFSANKTWESDRTKVKKGQFILIRTTIRNNGNYDIDSVLYKEGSPSGLEITSYVKIFDGNNTNGKELDYQEFYNKGYQFSLKKQEMVQILTQVKAADDSVIHSESTIQINGYTIVKDFEIEVMS